MKIEEQVLSIEQMKHLQELGVDTSDASMCGLDFEDNVPMEIFVFIQEVLIGYAQYKLYPAYTIGDLIEKLPKRIGVYYLLIDGDEIKYIRQETLFRSYFDFKDKSLVNALYSCLCWVAENHKELLEVKK